MHSCTWQSPRNTAFGCDMPCRVALVAQQQGDNAAIEDDALLRMHLLEICLLFILARYDCLQHGLVIHWYLGR